MNRTIGNLIALLVIALILGGNAFVLRDMRDIRSGTSLPPATPVSEREPTAGIVRIGVVSRFAPNITFSGYQPVLDYLNANSPYTFELRLSTSYQDAVEKLQRREVTASFLGCWIYSHLVEAGDLVPLVAPRNAAGQSAFHAVLVTRSDTKFKGPADLAGARIALPSADSWSGNWLQVAGLPAVGLTSTDLDSLHHFAHHQTVVWQVLRGHFDAGVVKESVAARYLREGLRPLTMSPAIPGPPLVAYRDAPPQIIRTLTELLLALNPDDPADQEILATWTSEFAHGFLAVTEADYDEAFGKLEAPR